MIITLFSVALAMSFFCLAMFIMMQEGHIFHWMRKGTIAKIEKLKADREEQIAATKAVYAQAKQKSIAEVQGPEHREVMKKMRDAEIATLEKNYETLIASFNGLKPVVICPLCFASFWGSIVFFMANWYVGFYPWTWWIILVWIFTCSITVLFNAILNAVCNKLDIY